MTSQEINKADDICFNNKCKLNHVRVCIAIECGITEFQPHLHHYKLPDGLDMRAEREKGK